jgi:hypothetical protein
VPKDPLDMLQAGERAVWTGRPSRYRMLRPIDVAVVAIGACWVVLGVPSVRDFTLPALPFLLLGGYALTARFVVRVVALRQARYLVTDRRLVLTGGLTGQAVVTADLSRLPDPVYTHQVDGSGDLAFGFMPGFWNPIGRRGPFLSFNQRLNRSRYQWRVVLGVDPLVPPRLLDIPDVADVAALVLATQQTLRDGKPGHHGAASKS